MKVISRFMWNSRNQSLIGLSMGSGELASLADVYQTMEEDCAAQTSYILQFLWRDLTSDYDIVGPYFTSSRTLESKFTLSCILETIKLFHLHGLLTSLLVCDGNLAVIKATPIVTLEFTPFEQYNILNHELQFMHAVIIQHYR